MNIDGASHFFRQRQNRSRRLADDARQVDERQARRIGIASSAFLACQVEELVDEPVQRIDFALQGRPVHSALEPGLLQSQAQNRQGCSKLMGRVGCQPLFYGIGFRQSLDSSVRGIGQWPDLGWKRFGVDASGCVRRADCHGLIGGPRHGAQAPLRDQPDDQQ